MCSIVSWSLLVSWWEQHHDTATSGTDYLDLHNLDNLCSLCAGKQVTASQYCRFWCKTLRRKIHSSWRSPAWDETMARQWERFDEDAAVGPQFGQDPPPSFSSPTLSYTYRHLRLWQGTLSLQKNRQGEMAFETAQRWEPDCSRSRHGRCVGAGRRHWFNRGRTGPVLGGHARPRQSFEDRKSLLRNTEGRQNGNDLHVLGGTEEAQFSTIGKCTGNVTNSSDQGLRDTARRWTGWKQLRQGGDVDRWQLRQRRRRASTGAVRSPWDATWNKWAKR